MRGMQRRDALILGACAILTPTFAQAKGARVNAVQVMKSSRRLDLLGDGKILKSYPIALGFTPVGAKRVEGDGKTPEGAYLLNARVPGSDFHLSMQVSYPNRSDLMIARRLGKPAGGNICVHGQPNGVNGMMRGDWTWGCVAMKNDDIEEMFRVVPVGTPIRIYA